MIRIKNNGKTYTISYYHNNKLIWCENEITEKSAKVYGLELPEIGETIDHNTDWRTVYLVDVKNNMKLYYCLEGLTEKIENLTKRMREKGQDYFISDDCNLDGTSYFDTLND